MAKIQKLELIWVGKNEPLNLEPRILIEDKEKSYGDENTENMIIHGDNLLALKALEQKYSGQVKCIYIDPPYNTGSAFEHYNDNVEHSTWLSLMRERLIILRNLLSFEGTIWIQIDDEEQAYLKVLCDEVFGRGNFINMISVNMKNIAGASGGGEDKRLKKNCEYILSYAKDYSFLPLFNGPYSYTEMSELIQQYIDEGKSWKYTTVLLDAGEKEYIGSTVDGDGNEIKVYIRKKPEMLSIKQVAKRDNITEKDAYKKYGLNIFQTTNAQSSIRVRIMEYRQEHKIKDDLISIEYIPKTGKNRGRIYEQFYKGDKCRLFVWLKDTSEIIDGELYKKDLQGTYWDMNAWMKNVAKEGDTTFPNGKKPEYLVKQILDMTTQPKDLILDSFLGSGTTCAVAHKMNRRYIGIELGEHCYTHCIPRLQRIVEGADEGGITKNVSWSGGGGFKVYELAPSLLKKDSFDNWVIDEIYNSEMLAEAMAIHEGFKYSPDNEKYFKQGKSSENSYIYTTTNYITVEYLNSLHSELSENESLVICCKNFDAECTDKFDNIIIKKIPKNVLNKCEFGNKNYNLNIIEENEEYDEDE